MGQVALVVQEQEVDATVHGIAWGQVVQLLSEDQGHPVALEEPAPVKMSVSQFLPAGSLDSLRSRLMRGRWW